MRPPPAEPGAAEAQARPMPRVRCVIWVEAPAEQPARPAMGRQSCLPAAKMTVPQWHPRCFSSPTATLRCSRAVRWPCREAAAIPCPESGRLRLRCSAKTARAAPRAARSPPRRRAAARRRGAGRDARAAGRRGSTLAPHSLSVGPGRLRLPSRRQSGPSRQSPPPNQSKYIPCVARPDSTSVHQSWPSIRGAGSDPEAPGSLS